MSDVISTEKFSVLRFLDLPENSEIVFEGKIEILKFLMDLRAYQRQKIEQKLPKCCKWLTSVRKTQIIRAVIKLCTETKTSIFYSTSACVRNGDFCVTGNINSARSELINLFEKHAIAENDIAAWWRRNVRPVKLTKHAEIDKDNQCFHKCCFKFVEELEFCNEFEDLTTENHIEQTPYLCELCKKPKKGHVCEIRNAKIPETVAEIPYEAHLSYIVKVMNCPKRDRLKLHDALPESLRWLVICNKTQIVAAVLKIILDSNTSEFIWSKDGDLFDFRAAGDLIGICDKLQTILKKCKVEIDTKTWWKRYIRYASPEIQLLNFNDIHMRHYVVLNKPEFFKPTSTSEKYIFQDEKNGNETKIVSKKRKYQHSETVQKKSVVFICGELIGNIQCGAEFDHRGKLMQHIFDHIPKSGFERKLKEKKIADLFSQNNISFERECYVNFRCIKTSTLPEQQPAMIHKSIYLTLAQEVKKSYVYIDFLIMTERCLVALEIDEHQHSEDKNPWSYTVACDVARMSHVSTAYTVTATGSNEPVQPILWIRYNPDTFHVNNERKLVPSIVREQKLLEIIRNFTPNNVCSILYMYYDVEATSSDKMRPVILSHEDYDKNFAKLVLPPVSN